MRMIPEVGDVVELKDFCFMNEKGGTGGTMFKWSPAFRGTAKVEVVKAWHDYECGWRFHGLARSDDLTQYLGEYAKHDDHRVFFHQSEVKLTREPSYEKSCPKCSGRHVDLLRMEDDGRFRLLCVCGHIFWGKKL